MSFRAVAAVVLLVLFAFVSHEQMWDRQAKSRHPEDVPGLYDRRMARLRERLPAHGTVGYRCEWQVAGEAADGHYYLAQYALCPLVVKRGDRLPQIIDAPDGVRIRTSDEQ